MAVLISSGRGTATLLGALPVGSDSAAAYHPSRVMPGGSRPLGSGGGMEQADRMIRDVEAMDELARSVGR